MRKNVVKTELYKLFHTKKFYICIGIGCLICLFNVLYIADAKREYVQMLEEYWTGSNFDPTWQSSSLYNCWIGGESFTLSFSVYFFIFPLLVTLPYGWSLYQEIHSGYLKNIAVRMKISSYVKIKYIAAFLSGGLTMIIPLILNFIAAAMVLPAVLPDFIYPFFSVSQFDFIGDLYYTYPILYFAIYMIIIFIECGLLSGLSFLLGYFVKYKMICVLLPFGSILFIHYFRHLIPTQYELSPLYFLHPTPVIKNNSGWVLLGFGLMLAIFSLIIFLIKGRNDYEIY